MARYVVQREHGLHEPPWYEVWAVDEGGAKAGTVHSDPQTGRSVSGFGQVAKRRCGRLAARLNARLSEGE